jgi:7-carboxy-7-deazaguanine synthase
MGLQADQGEVANADRGRDPRDLYFVLHLQGMKHYTVNEIFYSVQGEGVRSGTANIFVRFSGCNLTCNGEEVGEAFQPVCDTEFSSGRKLTLTELVKEVELTNPCHSIIFTGGEPALQVDPILIDAFKNEGYYLCIETNGTKKLPDGIDWVTVSPKTAEHSLAQTVASEVKYVRHYGQGIPKTQVEALHYLISPAFDETGNISRRDLNWAINLVKENPKWRLSVQQHKFWNVR